ncbi:uncharacterized protein N7459_008479 [Penicillium hispanicum]|uniref:uncharacterized protein n=1 Tax=Penicillium hispanicum TaxID=1080232 RepID=UPI002541A32F|nr:uncharacterized protein N7459_008479 [Penicillium hispanicum]KAJ5574052.1 hypothetical protein N7459_008479 [Penicillium hispanicum]
MSDSRVSVTLIPLDSCFPLTRSFTLSNDKSYIPIGRSSKREVKSRIPAKDNGWFDSRVMSRDHAELSLHPEKKIICLSDYGSTHGTWLNNVKLISGEATPLLEGDIIQFGVDVERGDEDFPALTVRCKVNWIDAQALQVTEGPYIAQPNPMSDPKPVPELRPVSSTNTFCVPDDDDSDVEEIPALKHVPPFEEAEAPSFHCSVEQLSPVLTGGLLPAHQCMNCQVTPNGEDVPEHVAQREAPQEVSEESELDSDRPSFEDESEIESDTSSLNNANEDFPANYGEDLDSSCSESDADYYESDSASVPDVSSEISSDEESSVGNQNDYIDPSLLAQKGNLAVDTVEQAIKNNEESKSSTNSSIKIEIPESKPEASVMIDFRARFPKTAIPHVLNPSVPQALEEGAIFQSYNAATQDFCPVSNSEILRAFQDSYKDGPFSCNDHVKKDSTPDESILTSAQTSLKRKASELEAQDAQIPDSGIPQSQEPDLNTISRSEIAANAIGSALCEMEPPNKRVKSNHSPTSKVASYTATAIVSALLGGLGTIALLAALPAEYFQ